MSDLALYMALRAYLDDQFTTLREDLMTARDDIAAAVAQLRKALDEIDTKISEGTVTAEDLQPLKDVAQALDDVVVDQPSSG